MIIVKILLILITTGLIVGLTGILVSCCIDSLTNIDATDAMQVFIIMALISLTLFVMFGIAALAAAFGIWTNM